MRSRSRAEQAARSAGLLLFAFGAAIWLVVVLFVLRPQPA
jgi:hypothetical protein